jgi:hypothetical protein
MDDRSDASRKCARCSTQIRDGDPVLSNHGEWYHVRCDRIVPSHVSSDEPPAVLCVVCRTGIRSSAELALLDPGPMHVLCRLGQPN